MTADRWKQISELYHSVLRLEPWERAGYLVEACGDDEQLRRELDSLLSAAERAPSFLEQPAIEVAAGLYTSAVTPDLTGRTLGRYEILARLAGGGFGEVYRARDTRLKRDVAVKVLRRAGPEDTERKRRFELEARAASALNHPNIITIYDIDSAEGVDFIAMEYVPGRTLQQALGRKGMKLNDALRVGIQVADALAAAHRAGIVHRDLKPGNIMLGESGQVKVLDFGLAKLSNAHSGESAVSVAVTGVPETEQGTVLGTVAYMSPEQAAGTQVDARSDIFSFGSVLYEAITGRRAFERESKLATLTAVTHEEPRPVTALVPDTPPELEKLIARCLRKDPERRVQHMDDVRLALEEIKEDCESGNLTAGAPPRHRSRARVLVYSAGIVILLLASGVAWFALRPRPDPPFVKIPLTSYPGYEQQPSLSPDGRQVAFSWNGEKQDNYDIYVIMASGGTTLRLTTSPARDTAPAWSPDGKQIAFIRDPGPKGAVYLISPLGGPARKLADTAGEGICWSADAKAVALTEGTSGEEAAGLILVSLETDEKRRLTSPERGFTDTSCAISPDGNELAFVRRKANAPFAGNVYVSSMAGAGMRRVTPRDGWIAGLAWMPAGGELLFGVDWGASFGGGLFRVAVNSRGGNPPRPVLPAEEGDFPAVCRAGDGTIRLAYVQEAYDFNIWRFDLPQAGAPMAGRARPIAASTHIEFDPQFSPDGEKIAFSSNRSGKFAIWSCDRDGANVVQLTNLHCLAGSPRWSPDGRQIAFDCTRGDYDIYLVSAHGGVARRFTTEASVEYLPSWSQDGRWIYFCSDRSGTGQIWKAPSAGGTAVQVTRNGGHEAFESPDGKLLYYTRMSSAGLWSVPTSGGEERLVLDAVRSFRWALVNAGIYFLGAGTEGIGRPGTPNRLKFWSFATRRVAEVATLEQAIPTESPVLAATPDGRRLLLVQADNFGSDLVLVEGFR